MGKAVINNLNEALHHFTNKKSKENLELEVVKSIEYDTAHSPICHIIRRKDDNYYFLFYREQLRTGFEKEFNLPGKGDEWLSLNLSAVKLGAFEYNNAVIVVVSSNGQIYYARSLDLYNFCSRHNTTLGKSNV
jgi:hypothetical protein